MLKIQKQNKDLKGDGSGNGSFGNIPKVKDYGYFTINKSNI